MKLAEALMERADLKKTIAQIENRMKENAKVQEGDTPAEDIEEIIPRYEAIMDSLEKLIVKINKTNNQTPFEESTLATALIERDCLKSKIKAYRNLYSESSIPRDRYSRNEIKYIRCVDIPKLQKIIDDLSKQYRKLDTNIQSINWKVDLVD